MLGHFLHDLAALYRESLGDLFWGVVDDLVHAATCSARRKISEKGTPRKSAMRKSSLTVNSLLPLNFLDRDAREMSVARAIFAAVTFCRAISARISLTNSELVEVFTSGTICHMAYSSKHMWACRSEYAILCLMPTGTKALPKNEDLKVALILDEERARQGMDQTVLAAKVGVSQSQISRMLDGTKPATITEFMKMCKALGLVASEVVKQAENSRT